MPTVREEILDRVFVCQGTQGTGDQQISCIPMAIYFSLTDTGESMPRPARSKRRVSCRSSGNVSRTKQALSASGLSIRGDNQHMTLFASVPLTNEHWKPLAEGELVAVSRGQLVARQLANQALILTENSLVDE